MRLYTKTGDGGETGLIGGVRVSKDHPRVAAYGAVDELNAAMGFSAAACDDEGWRANMQRIQDRLFVLGAELANPDAKSAAPSLSDDDVSQLEGWIDEAVDTVAPLKQFILPGGCELAARLHVARTVCRRSERCAVTLSREERSGGAGIVYLNRLADLLFAWARWANHRAGIPDVTWNPPDSTPNA